MKEKTISLLYQAVNNQLGILFYAACSAALHRSLNVRRELCDVLFTCPQDWICKMYLGMYLLLVALLSRAFPRGKKAAGQAEPLGNVHAESTEAFPSHAAAFGEICKPTSALARLSFWLQTSKTQRLGAAGKSNTSLAQPCSTFLHENLLRP